MFNPRLKRLYDESLRLEYRLQALLHRKGYDAARVMTLAFDARRRTLRREGALFEALYPEN